MIRTALTSANLRRANLRGAILTDAALLGARFDGADLRQARMQGVNAEGASFHNTRMDDLELDGANLLNTSGLSDTQLAAALGVEPESVAATLTAMKLRMESRESIVAALEPACIGHPVPDAGTGEFTPGSPHFVILGDDGKPAEEPAALSETDPGTIITIDRFDPTRNGRLDPLDTATRGRMEPMALRFVELVACIDTTDGHTEIERCGPYVLEGTGQRASDIARVRTTRSIRLVIPATGEAWMTNIAANDPPPCPNRAPASQTITATTPSDVTIVSVVALSTAAYSDL